MNGEHVAVTGDLLERLKQRAQHPTAYTPPSGAIGSVFGIPIVVDESLAPEPGWELRNKCPRMSAEEIRSAIDVIDKLMGRTHD